TSGNVSRGREERVWNLWVGGRLDLSSAAAPPPEAVEEAARRGPRGALAVGVVDAPVAGAHEQPRLGEPGHRTAQVGTIDGEDQELLLPVLIPAQVTHEGAGVGGDAVPRLAQWVLEGRQPRLVDRELAQRAQGHPAD